MRPTGTWPGMGEEVPHEKAIWLVSVGKKMTVRPKPQRTRAMQPHLVDLRRWE